MSENKQVKLTDRWRKDTGITLIDDDGNEENFTRKDAQKSTEETEETDEIEVVEED